MQRQYNGVMRSHASFLVLLVVIGLTGCRERIAVPNDEAPPPDVAPMIPVTLDPYPILDQMVTAYQTATAYSDHATVQIVGKMSHSDVEPTPQNCVVALQRPNRLHLEISEGVLVSDGEDCYAQIRSLPNQVVHFPSPEQWTLETLFQDVQLDRAMALELPPSVLRFPPQLVLLFANEPLNTFCPKGAKVEWVEQQNIGQNQCDVIQITHFDGNRLLWISQKNHALLRLDYLPVGLSISEGFDSIEAIRIEMADAQFDWFSPSETFQVQIQHDAVHISAFSFITSGLPSPEEHQHRLKLMRDSDCYRIIDPFVESAVLPEQPPTKVAPKTFTLEQIWKQPMAGADSMAFFLDETPKLLIPYESNLVAVFDLQGKALKKIESNSLEDSIIMNIRSNVRADKQRIGITTLDGKFYLFDESFNLLPTYQVEPNGADTEIIGDFRFMRHKGEDLLLLCVQQDSSKDNAAVNGVIRAVDLHGNIRWEYLFEGIPNQISSAFVQWQNRVFVSRLAPHSPILVLSPDGTASDPVDIPADRHVIWFHILDSTIYTLLENTGTGDVRFVGFDFRGNGQWSRLLPAGEYEAEPVYVPSEKKWLVPAPSGEIFVFDLIGNMVDQFSLGIVPTGLLCTQANGVALLIVADGETVSAWKIGKM